MIGKPIFRLNLLIHSPIRNNPNLPNSKITPDPTLPLPNSITNILFALCLEAINTHLAPCLSETAQHTFQISLT